MGRLRIGIGVGLSGAGDSIDAAIAEFQRAEEEGFHSVWTPNIFSLDALTVLALAGRATSKIELGVGVVPTHSRHPLYMAQQAMTTQLAAGGRLALGLGPSHKIVIENMLGLSFAGAAKHVREYVSVVKQLVETGKADFDGDLYQVHGGIGVPDAKPFPVLIGALGPLMRRVAGEVADGSITWMAGLRTLGEVVCPDIRKAAAAAGRPEPRVVAGLPVILTSDVAAARERCAKSFAMYGTLPSYRAMLDCEGAEPGDIALVGDEKALESSLVALRSAGVTDLNAVVLGVGDDRAASEARTRAFLVDWGR